MNPPSTTPRRWARAMALFAGLFIGCAAGAINAESISTQPAGLEQLNEARELIRIGRYDDATPLLQTAVRQAAPDSLDAAVALNELGRLDRLTAKYDEAEVFDRKAVEIETKLSGPDDPALATTEENLGELDNIRDRFDRAKQELGRAMEIRTKAFGEDNALTAESMSNLGVVELCLCNIDEGEKLCRRAVEIQNHTLKADDPDRAVGWDNLANVLEFRSNFVESERLFKRSLELRTRVLGDDHPDVGQSFDNLGGLYMAWNQPALARRHFKLAEFVRENSLGADHPDTMESLAMLGQEQEPEPQIYPPEQTSEKLERALEVEMKVLGPGHWTTQAVQAALAFSYIQQHRNPEAGKLLTAALNASRQASGEAHFNTASLECEFADYYTAMDQNREAAEQLYQQSLATTEKLYGSDDRATGIVLKSYAELLRKLNRNDEADKMEARSKAIEDADKLKNPFVQLRGPGL